MTQTDQKITNHDFAKYIEGLIKKEEVEKALQKCLSLSKTNQKSFLVFYYLATIFDIKNDSKNCVLCARQSFHNGVMSIYHLDRLGHMLTKHGQHEEARICFEGVLKEYPEKFECLFNVGIAHYKQGNYEEAKKYLEKAHSIEQNYNVFFNLGIAYRSMHEVERSREYFLKATKVEPENAEPYFGLASLAEYEGDKELTKQYYQKGLKFDPNKCLAYYSIAMLGDNKFIANENFIDRIKALLQTENLSIKDKGLLNLALGKIYENLKEYNNAFKYYNTGNTHLSSVQRYNPEKIDYIYSCYQEAFTQERQKTFSKNDCKNTKPIFIVGMPRSGTTLTEQIITSHSQAETIGESKYLDHVLKEALKKYNTPPFPMCFERFSTEDFKSYGSLYTSHIENEYPKARKIINKTPDNFLNVGSIFTLLPNATIINCKRHPLDACLSAYFIGFDDNSLIYSYHLEDIAKRYKQYVRFMNLWNKEYPNKILDLYYEKLVLEPKKVSQELISFCGLQWEDSCIDFSNKKSIVSTASKWQIRDQIYTDSLFKWKRYDKHIGVLKDNLQEEIKLYEEELNKQVKIT